MRNDDRIDTDRTSAHLHCHGNHDLPRGSRHRAVAYTCSDGTRLQATFSPPSAFLGSVKLVFARPSAELTLPRALSADGGRYAQGDVEFWIKGQGATLTREGKQTTCRTRS